MDKETLLSYQPDYYKNSLVLDQLNNANALELTIANNKVTQEYNNLYPDTADSATLSRFEKDNGLIVSPSYNKDYRVSRIYSRMIGQRNFSIDIIKSIAENFNYGNISVTLQLPFQFTIKFTSKIGIPPNIDDLKTAIEQIKPAYMLVNYEYSYLLVNDINNMIISDLNNILLNKFAMGGN